MYPPLEDPLNTPMWPKKLGEAEASMLIIVTRIAEAATSVASLGRRPRGLPLMNLLKVPLYMGHKFAVGHNDVAHCIPTVGQLCCAVRT